MKDRTNWLDEILAECDADAWTPATPSDYSVLAMWYRADGAVVECRLTDFGRGNGCEVVMWIDGAPGRPMQFGHPMQARRYVEHLRWLETRRTA